ncbi:hypothetical protein SAMN05216359_108137 [Roseateles sp. YR242]|uniref:extracellular catalytic domain type 2 short-chain-length polyhydroxyalkanoate depolymerase n=1 Tax=Roseateles sp. YR242 TaxID=1855305 RepID=UPI0008B3C2DE|nr:poly(3-hydroxybutyrate) depolymerase [Roseateles sp. YR242]SEL38923.1 hypothetical protein SAMN05216359_108137 [Roseateles sp. YR242]
MTQPARVGWPTLPTLPTIRSRVTLSIRRHLRVAGVMLLTTLVMANSPASHAAGPLPALHLEPGITVSGLSSGAYMAAQYAVAFSREVVGVGVVAGGPWDCAQGRIDLATTNCSCVTEVCNPTTPSVLAFQATQRARGKAGVDLIDPLEELKKQRVWLFRGQKDHTVPPGNVQAVALFYSEGMHVPASQVKSTQKASAGHGLPVVDVPGAVACGLSEPPYLNDCGVDAAGDLLTWLYPGRTSAGDAANGELQEFDQRPYLHNLEYTGLADTGYVYVPTACKAGQAPCALHVVFHGCRQSRDALDPQGQPVGSSFVQRAGYNRWAAASRLVVLYPQVLPVDTGTPLVGYRYNPRGCWDFWGYTRVFPSTSLHTTKAAPQMLAVRAMVEALRQR